MKINYWQERERDLRNSIKNLPETRVGQKTKAQLKEKLRAARAKVEAADQERQALTKEESK